MVRYEQTISEREKQIKQLNQFVAKRDEHIAEINGEIATLLSSTSWRITKPIRVAKNIINTLGPTKPIVRR